MRIVSWNIQNRGHSNASRLGVLLRDLDPCPDLVLLQEVNRRSIDTLCSVAGLTWWRLAVDLLPPSVEDTPGRRLGVAICGRNSEPTNCLLLEQAPLPARALIAAVTVDGVQLQVASYHAPPGVSWKILKPRQAVLFARWLAATNGPVIFGADGNTPVLDAIDFKNSRTHWHSGSLSLHGEPGDDLLFGPDKIHPLDDALRLWLKQHPDELDRLAAERPQGPLAVSYRTGRRKNSPGTDRRFDAVWVSPQFLVTHVHYPYEDSCTAGSDHSAVVVDLTMSGS